MVGGREEWDLGWKTKVWGQQLSAVWAQAVQQLAQHTRCGEEAAAATL